MVNITGFRFKTVQAQLFPPPKGDLSLTLIILDCRFHNFGSFDMNHKHTAKMKPHLSHQWIVMCRNTLLFDPSHEPGSSGCEELLSDMDFKSYVFVRLAISFAS